MKRLSLFVFVTALAAAQDFRNATWGMTIAQVLVTESTKPSDIHENNGEIIVRYDLASMPIARCAGRVVYVFAQDKLVRAKYLFDAEHRDFNDFIRDFKLVQPNLVEQYGQPISDRAFWGNDLLQDEPKSYLEQDRASSENILPSDRLVGLEIALGHLKLYTSWTAGRTRILHGLTGQDYHVVHQVEYLSLDAEESPSLRGENQGAPVTQ